MLLSADRTWIIRGFLSLKAESSAGLQSIGHPGGRNSRQKCSLLYLIIA